MSLVRRVAQHDHVGRGWPGRTLGRRSRPVRAVALVALVGAVASCNPPDRSSAAEDLRRQLAELTGVADAEVQYSPSRIGDGTSEYVEYRVVVDPAEGAAVACAVVRTFVEGFAATGISADQATIDVSDTEPSALAWRFTATAEADAATARPSATPPSRSVRYRSPFATDVEASSTAYPSRPKIRLFFDGDVGVATSAKGEALAQGARAVLRRFRLERRPRLRWTHVDVVHRFGLMLGRPSPCHYLAVVRWGTTEGRTDDGRPAERITGPVAVPHVAFRVGTSVRGDC